MNTTIQIGEIVHGEIRAVRPDFCFVRLDGDDRSSLFVHASQFDHDALMVVGQRIWCSIGKDKDNRLCGKAAKIEGQR